MPSRDKEQMPAGRRLGLVAAACAVAFAVAAPPAQAKGVASVSVCGAEACTMVAHAERGSSACPHCSVEELLRTRPGSAQPTRRAPYVQLILTSGAPGEQRSAERLLFSPALGLAARSNGRGGWSWF